MYHNSSSQVKSERDIPPVSSVQGSESMDTSIPPERYLRRENPSSGNTPREVARSRNSDPKAINSDQRSKLHTQASPKPSVRSKDRQQRQSAYGALDPRKWFFGGHNEPDSFKLEAEQHIKAQANKIEQLTSLLHEKEDTMRSMSESRIKDEEHQHRHFRDECQQMANEIHKKHLEIEAQKDDTIQSLQVQVQELASDQKRAQAKYNTLVQRHQEESFKQMETGRWLPKEGSRVRTDFERTRTQMRAWAKSAAVKNIAVIQDLEKEQYASLMDTLSCVALIKNNQLPHGLSTAKGASLLLNALLAHDLLMSLFGSPFFFLNDDVEYGATGEGLDDSLNQLHYLALASNKEDANVWRSQTLRLLFPPLRADSTQGEMRLHQSTKEKIVKVAEQHALRFASSPARYLIDTKTSNIKKLISIYQDAASDSYMLWTRRIAMEVVPGNKLGSLIFDVDDSRFKPHTMVHPDDHDDKLKGRQITLIVNPLLRVYGTDEGKDYDHARVWVPAEVWFDTK